MTSAPGDSVLCLGVKAMVLLALVFCLVTAEELAAFPGLLKGFNTKNGNQKRGINNKKEFFIL